MTASEKYPVLASIDRELMRGIVRELGQQFKEHDPLADHADEKALYARLGARSVVNWLSREFIEPKPTKQDKEDDYPQW